MTVSHQPGAAAVTVRSVRVEYSTDDGKTWQRAVVNGSGDHRVAQVRNPRNGFVSLRVTATDAKGFTVSETMIRAYGIK